LELVSQKKHLQAIIFDFEWMNNIDSSWIWMLKNLVFRLKSMGIKLYITNLRVNVYQKFAQIGFVKEFWESHFYNEINDAVEHVIEKFWKKSDIKMLLEYKKDRKKTPQLNKKMRKKYKK
jgi:anti-anti-sigma regulatory factor